jgi:hypothetical protein
MHAPQTQREAGDGDGHWKLRLLAAQGGRRGVPKKAAVLA